MKRTGRARTAVFAGAAVLIVIAGVAAMLSIPGVSGDGGIRDGANAFVQSDAVWRRLTCLKSLPFEGQEVFADEGNLSRRADYDALVEAGLLQQPVMQKGAWFTPDRLRYAKTPAGQGISQDNRLCVPGSIAITELHSEAPVESIAGKHVLAHFKYKFSGKAEWLRNRLRQIVARDIKPEGEQSVLLWWNQGKWTPIAADPDYLAYVRSQTPAAQPSKFTLPDWGGKKSLDNPFIGRWTQKTGWFRSEIELGEKDAFIGGERRAVRYEPKNGHVLLHIEGARGYEVLTALGRNHFQLSNGGNGALFERVDKIQ